MPFKRQDTESGMHKTPTDNDLRSPLEEARRASHQDDFPGPQKADTFPAGPSTHLPTSRDTGDVASSSEEGKPSTEKAGLTEGDDVERGLSGSDGPMPDGGQTVRQRRGLRFWKKEQVDDSEKPTRERKRDKFGPPPPITSQFKAVMFSWINLLLIFVPVGFALEYAHVNKIIVFVINFLAIVPLAALLSFATEELALYIGETLGGLLNATFGNAVELIVSVIALTQGKIIIVQTSLVGSMLSNLLLVLGM